MIESRDDVRLGICNICGVSNIIENTIVGNKIFGLCPRCSKQFK